MRRLSNKGTVPKGLCLKSRKMPRACPVVLHVCRYLPNQTKQLDATALRRGGSRFHN